MYQSPVVLMLIPMGSFCYNRIDISYKEKHLLIYETPQVREIRVPYTGKGWRLRLAILHYRYYSVFTGSN